MAIASDAGIGLGDGLDIDSADVPVSPSCFAMKMKDAFLAQDYSFMTDQQLLELCGRLRSCHGWMNALHGQLHTEKGKLLKQRGDLREQIQALQAACSGDSADVAAGESACGEASRGRATELSAPEDFLVQTNARGDIELSWFYDEDVLEQLEKGTIQSLSFQVRQQSEGLNGRLRTRVHNVPCRSTLPSRGNRGEVGEQRFAPPGCIVGRTYSFTVCAVIRYANGAHDYTSPYCAPIIAKPADGCLATATSVPTSPTCAAVATKSPLMPESACEAANTAAAICPGATADGSLAPDMSTRSTTAVEKAPSPMCTVTVVKETIANTAQAEEADLGRGQAESRIRDAMRQLEDARRQLMEENSGFVDAMEAHKRAMQACQSGADLRRAKTAGEALDEVTSRPSGGEAAKQRHQDCDAAPTDEARRDERQDADDAEGEAHVLSSICQFFPESAGKLQELRSLTTEKVEKIPSMSQQSGGKLQEAQRLTTESTANISDQLNASRTTQDPEETVPEPPMMTDEAMRASGDNDGLHTRPERLEHEAPPTPVADGFAEVDVKLAAYQQAVTHKVASQVAPSKAAAQPQAQQAAPFPTRQQQHQYQPGSQLAQLQSSLQPQADPRAGLIGTEPRPMSRGLAPQMQPRARSLPRVQQQVQIPHRLQQWQEQVQPQLSEPALTPQQNACRKLSPQRVRTQQLPHTEALPAETSQAQKPPKAVPRPVSPHPTLRCVQPQENVTVKTEAGPELPAAESKQSKVDVRTPESHMRVELKVNHLPQRSQSPHGTSLARSQSPHRTSLARPLSPHRTSLVRPQSPHRTLAQVRTASELQPEPLSQTDNHAARQFHTMPQLQVPQTQSQMPACIQTGSQLKLQPPMRMSARSASPHLTRVCVPGQNTYARGELQQLMQSQPRLDLQSRVQLEAQQHALSITHTQPELQQHPLSITHTQPELLAQRTSRPSEATVQPSAQPPPSDGPPPQASPMRRSSSFPAVASPQQQPLQQSQKQQLQQSPMQHVQQAPTSVENREVTFTILHPQEPQLGCSPQTAVQPSVQMDVSVSAQSLPGTPRKMGTASSSRPSVLWPMSPMTPQRNLAQSLSASSPDALMASPLAEQANHVPTKSPRANSARFSGPKATGQDGMHVNLDRLQTLLQEFKGQQAAKQAAVVAEVQPPIGVAVDSTSSVALNSAASVPVSAAAGLEAWAREQAKTPWVPHLRQLPRSRSASRSAPDAAVRGTAVASSAAAAAANAAAAVRAGAVNSAAGVQVQMPAYHPSIARPLSAAAPPGTTPLVTALQPQMPQQLPQQLPPQQRSPLPQQQQPLQQQQQPLQPMQQQQQPLQQQQPQPRQQPRSRSREAARSLSTSRKLQQDDCMLFAPPLGFPPMPNAVPSLPGMSALANSGPLGQVGMLGAGLAMPPPVGSQAAAAVPPSLSQAAPVLRPDEAELPPPPRCAPAAWSETPPPPRSAPADVSGWSQLPGGSFDAPPPPRCAPASSNLCWTTPQLAGGDSETDPPLTERISVSSTDMVLEGGMTRPVVSGEGNFDIRQYVLRVQAADERWETFAFFGGKDLGQQAATFLRQHAIKPAFQNGLVAKMQQMLASGQQSGSVDIVDLI